MTDRLYRVLVTFEYVALASSAAAAEDMVDDVLRDMVADEMTIRATMLRDAKGRYLLPEGYSDDWLVYGDREERTLEILIAQERHALAAGGGE